MKPRASQSRRRRHLFIHLPYNFSQPEGAPLGSALAPAAYPKPHHPTTPTDIIARREKRIPDATDVRAVLFNI